MRYTITKQRIEVLGYIWMPNALCAQVRDLSAYDMENLGDARNRDDVERWIALHCGDFSRVVDFRADFDVDGEHIEHAWTSEENELAFNDAMYPSEDDAAWPEDASDGERDVPEPEEMTDG